MAEDNELNREIAAFLLKDEGISVTEAEDGQQAARAIRGSGKKDAEMIPIIAITANAFAEDKRKTMEADMSVTEKRITEG